MKTTSAGRKGATIEKFQCTLCDTEGVRKNAIRTRCQSGKHQTSHKKRKMTFACELKIPRSIVLRSPTLGVCTKCGSEFPAADTTNIGHFVQRGVERGYRESFACSQDDIHENDGR